LASKISFIILILILLGGCECDSICESGKRTREVLANYKSDAQVINYLVEYYGEGPGNEKYNVFVQWGLDNQNAFISIINSPDISKNVLHLIAYTISDIGYSKEYCDVYKSLPQGSDFKLKDLLLGCV